MNRLQELQAKETLTQAEAKELAGLEAQAEASKSASHVEANQSVKDIVNDLGAKIAEAIAQAKGVTVSEHEKGQMARNPQINPFAEDPKNKGEIWYPSDLTKLSKSETIVTFFKALVRRDDQSRNVIKALVEGTDGDGGYLVPEVFATEVWRVLPDQVVMRRLARILPMTTDTLNLNTLTALPEAYWTDEYASKATTSAEFGRVVLSPNKLVCLLPVTQELLADANINMVDFIVQIFAERIGGVEDKAYFTGSGTGQPKGINQETLTTVAAGGNASFDHIIALLDSVPQKVSQSPSAAFVGNRYVKRILRQLKDTNGAYIWRDGGSGSGETRRLPDTLYGYPFHEQNDLSQTELYFGDWKFYVIGDRMRLTVMTTMEGGDAWRRDSMEIKAKIRVDGKAVLTSPFAKATGVA